MNELGDGASPLYLVAILVFACAHITAFCLGIVYGLSKLEFDAEERAAEDNRPG